MPSHLAKVLLSQSDDDFDEVLKNVVRSWKGDTYTSLQIFELIDTGRTYERASPIVLERLQRILELQLGAENKTVNSLITEINWWKASKENI